MLGRIPLTNNKEIRVNLKEFRGTKYLDLRIYFKVNENEDLTLTEEQLYIPSKRGLTIKEEYINPLLYNLINILLKDYHKGETND